MNVPKLRFKEFDGEWEYHQFSEIANRVSKSSNSNILPKVEFEDIVAGEGRLKKNVANKFDDRKGTLFQPNNILYGKLRPYLKNWLFPKFQGVALGDFWVFEAVNIAPAFLYALIQSENYQRVANDTAGTKMPRSDWKKVSTTKFAIPMNIKEQEKIGDFFEILDKKIQLQQQKIDLLQEQKKGFLQKMFPKSGETQPEMRFEGFEKEWGESKLGELMNVTSVKRIHQSDWTDSGVRFLRARDIVSAAKGEGPANYLYISQEKYDEYSKISGEVEIGDLLVTGVGSIGVPMIIDREEPLYFKDGNVIWFQNRNQIDGNFLYYSFVGRNIQKFIHDVAGVGTVGTYTIDSGRKTPIHLPSRDEQQKIGLFFKRLDNEIILQKGKLKLIQQQKKGFMQQMFI